ncbi:MAG: alpha-glucan family phosphorylase [Candidatus Aenigmatarchaeota archaeon]
MSEKSIAYFCMEYGLDSDFKIYAGGLGILSGDMLKAAEERDDDIIGIGVLWQEGYTEQVIEKGKPVDKSFKHDYDFLEETGIKFDVEVKDEDIRCKVYEVTEFGNKPLYLIDTEVETNSEWARNLTSRLYGGSWEDQLVQKIFFAKAGLKLVEILDFEPDFYHLSETDSVFVAIELLKEKLGRWELEEAKEEVKKAVRFTTHTPIDAGNPKYNYSLLHKVGYPERIPYQTLEKIAGKPFNTTLVGLRLSGKANAVSKRHMKTVKDMWSKYMKTEPIVGVTNGIHLPTWRSKKIKEAGSDELWEAHQEHKKELVEHIGADIDMEKPLIGFAKRMPDYKRPHLIFHDIDRFEGLKDDINIVFSGKAHPDFEESKKRVEKIVGYADKYDSVHWIENYSMEDGEKLVKGSDVWLSCAVPPKEACSTSVMKAAVNGVLNLSTLDGWWWEACNHGENGWQYGDGEIFETRAKQDEHDAEALYRAVEEELIPAYRDRKKWVEMMRSSIKTVKGNYTAKKMLEKYYTKVWQ